MKRTSLLSHLLLAACCGLWHGAGTAQVAAAGTLQQITPASDDNLYKALGEKANIAQFVDAFVNSMVADPRIGPLFKNRKLPDLKEQITNLFCVLSGGPCVYEGDSMKVAHQGLGITKANFNQVVELLQVAMDGKGVPFREQNKLLALLAPMHRDIIAPAGAASAPR